MAHTVDQAIAWVKAHPTKDVGEGGPSWNGWCAALVFWAGGFERSFPSAMAAGSASGTLNPRHAAAPRGAIHYWADAGGDGHTAIELGGNLLLMASGFVTDSWGRSIGTIPFAGYAAQGLPYRGWSLRWGTESLAGAGAPAAGFGFGLTSAAQEAAQGALKRLGLYGGIVDGAFGERSVAAMQTYLRQKGLLPADYVIDGEPGPRYGAAIQNLAKGFGYAGVVDGAPGARTSEALIRWAKSISGPTAEAPVTDWKAWQAFLARHWGYAGLVDGVPGERTFATLQQFLAKTFGYTGVVDGVPGDLTWAAFARAIAAGYPKEAAASATVHSAAGGVHPSSGAGAWGIDVSRSQASLDFARAKAEGVEFVVVKAAGLNVSPQYIADEYAQNVDEVIAAGLPKGHYYVPGRPNLANGRPDPAFTPEQQADFFVDGLHRFDAASDVLCLDNEPLNANGVFWTQGDVVKFITRVQERTGIPFERIWVYFPADLTRRNAPWEKVTDLSVRVWWAAYGHRPTGHEPDHQPNLDGKIARVDVHQYTDSAAVAGFAVDANRAQVSVSELFAGAV